MNLIIAIKDTNAALSLPIAHHHILQSVYYNLMRDDLSDSSLHEDGYRFGKRDYKLFTFGPIRGKYVIKGDKIIFSPPITMEFRTIDPKLIKTMRKNAEEKGIMFGQQVFREISTEICDASERITSDELVIDMISPICVYRTEQDGHTTRYFRTDEDDFYRAVSDNFTRKYQAAFGTHPDSQVELMPYRIGPKDKYFTKYKNYYIEAYKGKYILKGKPECLRFLYDTGLGSKNSQGFGMFSVI